MSKLIKRDWRNWKPQQTPSGKRSTPGFDSFQSLGGGGDSNIQAVKPKSVKKKAVKLDNIHTNGINNKDFIRKTPARIKISGNKSLINNNNFNFRAKKMNKSHKSIRLDNFDDSIEWSNELIISEKREINKNRARSIVSKANTTKDRRLSGALAIMVSKLAEDKSGEPIVGEDEWDVQELMMRTITKRNIYNCMQSRERENIVLALDSSPSCRRTSQLYSKIAYLSCKFGGLDIYLTPNARVTHKMNAKTSKYEKVFSVPRDSDMIVCNMDAMNNFFRNRVILFFGDFDGYRQICLASNNNEIYWLNNDYDDGEEPEEYLNGRKFNGTMFSVSNKQDLINVIRKLR
jgi:hypothetical protein